jgi:rod shape determining protein RodA
MSIHSMNRTPTRTGMDYALFWALAGSGLFGVLMIYSATRQALVNAGDNPHYYLERQLVFVVAGIALMWIVSRIDFHRLELLATPGYVISLIALVAVRFLGSSALGAQRWFNLGFVQLQPSEFSVVAIIIAIATYAARRPEGITNRDVGRLLLMFGTPLFLIVFQPDLGTSIILLVAIGIELVMAGVPPRLMVVLAVGGSLLSVFAIYFGLLHQYQINRLTAFLNQNSNDGQMQQLIFQVTNAKSAIGSGGLFGAGFFRGLQTTLGYVPEQRTDFIFTAIGEQLGLAGCLWTIGLLSFVGYRMYKITRETKDIFGRLLCTGIFVFFAFSCIQNIGMTMGVMPIAGIPLPLISYGGSAAVVFFVSGGIVLSVGRRRI